MRSGPKAKHCLYACNQSQLSIPSRSQFCMYQKKQIRSRSQLRKQRKQSSTAENRKPTSRPAEDTHTKQRENRIQNTNNHQQQQQSQKTSSYTEKDMFGRRREADTVHNFGHFPLFKVLKFSSPFCKLTKFIPPKNTFLEHFLKKQLLFFTHF